jgi:hypothetical protein
MDAGDATLWGSLGAALVALAWALVRRIKKARRVMPRGRFRMSFSLRTPETTEPPKRGRREPRSLEPSPYHGTDQEPTDPDHIEIIDTSEDPDPDDVPTRRDNRPANRPPPHQPRGGRK